LRGPGSDYLLAAALPLAAASLKYKREQAMQQWWADLCAAAPRPVWDYIERITAESQADPTFVPNDGQWCERHHPLWWEVVEALHTSFHRGDDMQGRLHAVQTMLSQRSPDDLHAAELALLDAH
jgi:hypothetical protein